MAFETVEKIEEIVEHKDCKLEECRRSVVEYVVNLMVQWSPELDGCYTVDDAEYLHWIGLEVQIYLNL